MSPASSQSDSAYVLHCGKKPFFKILLIDNNNNNNNNNNFFHVKICVLNTVHVDGIDTLGGIC